MKEKSILDVEKARREWMRWLILQTLYVAHPVGFSDRLIHNTVEQDILDATLTEILRELEYLEDRDLLTIERRPGVPAVQAKINRRGIDVVEYTVDCHPGIARPPKW